MDSKLLEVVRKHAVKNALEHGKATVGSVAGKVIAEMPSTKNDLKAAMALINEQVTKVNFLSREALENEAKGYEYYEKKEEKSGKLELPHCHSGKVVTRFAPEPSGHPHIGHAKAAWLSRKLADDWQGAMFLRFDDTNPEKETQEYVDALQKDLTWLGVKADKVQYASDYLPQLYEYAEKLISSGDAYACSCTKEQIALGREKKQACSHRDAPPEENLSTFRKMVAGRFKEGEIILRLKGSLSSNNTVMRDPTIFRVINAPHYRQGEKFKAWPNYDFEVAVTDSLTGVTHALRSKEYELRDELYAFILDKLSLRRPFVYDFSRLNIKGTLLSKRFLRPLIDARKVSGWDDPRLPTLAGLQRRGLQPEAIKSFVLSFGLSKVESQPGWTALVTENRKLLDPFAERRFFVPFPIELTAEDAPEKTVVLKNHPTAAKGARELLARKKFFIPRSDAETLAVQDLLRLKDLYTVRITSVGLKVSAAFVGEGIAAPKTVQWVPADPHSFSKATVVKPLDLVDEKGAFNDDSLEVIEGACEKSCDSLAGGSIVQFERFGFVRKDSEHGYVYVG